MTQISPATLYVVMLVVAALLVLLGVFTTLLNVGRSRHDERVAARLAHWRPLLMHALYGDAELDFVHDRKARNAVMVLARSLLPSLRGEDQIRLAALLESSGVVDEALRELHSRSAVRRAGAAELLGLALVERSVPELIRVLGDGDPDVRRTAAHALGIVETPEAVRPLLQTIEDRTVPLNTTTMALLRMPREANAALIEGLETSGDRVRATCAELLGLRSALSAVHALTAALECDPALEVRIRAARALGAIGAPASVDALAWAMRRDQPVPLRAVATRALGVIGGVRTVGLLRDALDAPEHVIAMNAARALTHAGDEGEEALRRAEQGGSRRRREYAREGLSYIELRRIERQSA